MSSISATAWRLRNKEKARKAVSEWQKRNPEKVAERQTSWSIRNPERRMLTRCKSRAKRDGVEFNITLVDIIIPKVCPLLGIALEHGFGRGGFRPCSPSLDRKDPSKGYVKGNVWVISQRANAIKNNATVEELERVVQALKAELYV